MMKFIQLQFYIPEKQNLAEKCVAQKLLIDRERLKLEKKKVKYLAKATHAFRRSLDSSYVSSSDDDSSIETAIPA